MDGMLILTIAVGVFVLIVDLLMSYGGVLFWSENRRSIAIAFFCSVIAVTAAYVNTVILVWYE